MKNSKFSEETIAYTLPLSESGRPVADVRGQMGIGKRPSRSGLATTQRLATSGRRHCGPYSHSIINEPSKLLIGKVLAAASQTFTVTFTVKVRSTSTGAGLRAIRPEATFTRSIDIYRLPRPLRTPSTSLGVGQGNDQKSVASNALSYCPK